MGYVTENLLPGEKVVYQTRLHWIVFVGPALLVIIGLLIRGGGDTTGIGSFIIGLGVILGIVAAINRSTAEFAVTDKRVLVKVGLVRRRSLEINLAKIESVAVDQGILGRILNYGVIIVRGTGGTQEPFKRIADPMAFRRHVQEQGTTAQGRP